ncbi:hypothetical protein HOLleu_42496 [Holothuria leucospilota]|uniref:Peptidase A2 domain-containing protein n=1 Tax=Holothuria leucospilota TaxID=206669 RepID=A0A9Q0YCM6_HOLLE|nr:hypothetical protein HOLleu_42496 [Holothuria leucospilota]
MIFELKGWDDTAKALQLAACLRGPAQAVLADLDESKRRDFRSLTEALTQRFEPIKLPVPWSQLRSVGASGLYVRSELEGDGVKFLVDTRADLTVIRAELYERLSGDKHVSLEQIPLDMAEREGKFRLKIGELQVMHDILVADIDMDAPRTIVVPM